MDYSQHTNHVPIASVLFGDKESMEEAFGPHLVMEVCYHALDFSGQCVFFNSLREKKFRFLSAQSVTKERESYVTQGRFQRRFLGKAEGIYFFFG